ncbi:Protein phosphatase regulatory subunit Gac1, putative [Penicillium digitatum PHI26]|uniref:Protein phosphatase regulatory subunit Gac1, putative n=2 Tax=Penicillium digitatum TaxID=36651 RepID=K9FIX8_PEND2|nr:Protein phosphatase regulatory subunit Gac1, putative [Penicillium digitatum Pd1]EKV06429.1 Protein phosphatase regulatory subunit Gac1, putative [Penicillium digitatum Pd1]EKV08177.1 Protein phosphatase regulatory subunit Gac1, putative [Penicillium digitatum PHI26]
MPYTAPLKTLLSAQHIEYSRPTEESGERPGLAYPSSERVQNPRSYSSTSYTRRHRRSPSNTKPTVHTAPESPARASPSLDPPACLRQSPPPISNAIIPPGAVISPPESGTNSSDEESPHRSGEGVKFDELEAAVRSIRLRRESSPERMDPSDHLGTALQHLSSVPSATGAKPTRPKLPHLPLSKEARKISHSRSSTETAIELARESALTSSPEESDVEMSCKPLMVRKKSGELVRPALRPSSSRRRPSSMPGTPVYSKAVHFDSHLEHIRHFLQLDRPLAVSTETSPVETHDNKAEFPFGSADSGDLSWEWEIKLSNWPKDPSSRVTRPVRLERLFLSADKSTLIGTVAVANIAFHKNVTARFTLDYWRTTSEVAAAYCHDVRRQQAADGFDRFSFDLKLNDQAHLETKTMFMCIRYNVEGQEFWDNNDSVNYQVDFHKVPKNPTSKSASGGSRPALPRSRSFTSSHATRPQPMPHNYDFSDISGKTPFTNPFNGANGAPLTRTPSDDIDAVAPPKRRENSNRQAFGNRYDFGASLSAAMRSKAPLDRTALTARARSGETVVPETSKPTKKTPSIEQGHGSPVSDNFRTGSPVVNLKPSSLVSSKPQLESSVYRELVDKYCFYGSPQASNQKAHPPISSGRDVEAPKHISAPACPSSAPACPSPPLSPRSPAPLAAPVAEAPRASVSPRASPLPSASPLDFRYSFHGGFMNDPHSPAVIRG